MTSDKIRILQSYLSLFLILVTCIRAPLGAAYSHFSEEVGTHSQSAFIALPDTSIAATVDSPIIMGAEVTGKAPRVQFLSWGIPLFGAGVHLERALRLSLVSQWLRCSLTVPEYSVREMKFPTHYFW
ncbi:hypothetical protein ADIS_2456 [Lunatimonas lonarensis]|uniref:Uncharacterized protein n=1 Tax=Lunatimonas lonarensis TaxID=1232681 RepID=R7ZSU1_9BACT|nr:hypothetical protein [Lunatimonas lonarensis]EON77074.1 hypothetical protein ADIS_2456 [Lunatimonas lonarensis]